MKKNSAIFTCLVWVSGLCIGGLVGAQTYKGELYKAYDEIRNLEKKLEKEEA